MPNRANILDSAEIISKLIVDLRTSFIVTAMVVNNHNYALTSGIEPSNDGNSKMEGITSFQDIKHYISNLQILAVTNASRQH